MAIVLADLLRWFEEGKEKGATHIIIVCDTYDYSDFPVYVMKDQDAREVAKKEREKSMQRVMEVYSLSLSPEDQFNEPRAYHF